LNWLPIAVPRPGRHRLRRVRYDRQPYLGASERPRQDVLHHRPPDIPTGARRQVQVRGPEDRSTTGRSTASAFPSFVFASNHPPRKKHLRTQLHIRRRGGFDGWSIYPRASTSCYLDSLIEGRDKEVAPDRPFFSVEEYRKPEFSGQPSKSRPAGRGSARIHGDVRAPITSALRPAGDGSS